MQERIAQFLLEADDILLLFGLEDVAAWDVTLHWLIDEEAMLRQIEELQSQMAEYCPAICDQGRFIGCAEAGSNRKFQIETVNLQSAHQVE